ncbi:MAG: hypothetical protein IPG05_03935 [Gemmatimonadetes bacterium]|nr:hypothetical protein [Gemmatimonadota bacterium]
MTRTALFTALVLSAAVAACSDDPTGNGDPGPILIAGGDMGPRFENFSLSRDGAPLTDAVVKINGTTLPASSTGSYNYDRGSALAAGEELVIRVEHDGDVVEGRATMIEGPTLTAPVADQVITYGQPLTVTWTSVPQPDYWTISMTYSVNGAGNGHTDSLPPAARSSSFPTTVVPASAINPAIGIYSYLRGTFTGPADPASNMRVRAGSSVVNLVKAP